MAWLGPGIAAGSTSLVRSSSNIPARFNVSHRVEPVWTERLRYDVSISALFRKKGEKDWNPFASGALLPKNCNLRFRASTNCPERFSVYWQVVNTGNYANDLRGQIFPAKTAGKGGLIYSGITHDEYTQYKGMHWIECFLVSDDVLVAKSGEFVVNIR